MMFLKVSHYRKVFRKFPPIYIYVGKMTKIENIIYFARRRGLFQFLSCDLSFAKIWNYTFIINATKMLQILICIFHSKTIFEHENSKQFLQFQINFAFKLNKFCVQNISRPVIAANHANLLILHLDGKYVVLPSGELQIRNVSAEDGFKTYKCRTKHRLTGI